MPAPRLFGIPARDAPVVAVLRRGPSDWFHLGRWDVERMAYEPGAWLRGTVYPQRCDLSPDGRWFAYVALKAGADWAPGPTYVAISRLPWLTALAAWGTGGTWTRGVHFVDSADATPLDPPDVGSLDGLPRTTGLAVSRAHSFAVERRRGWTETARTPPRAESDTWDERRDVEMDKPDPTWSGTRLVVSGGYAAFRGSEVDRRGAPRYALARPGRSRGALSEVPEARPLDGLHWADWSADGRLLVATAAGELQVRAPDGHTIVWRHDLAAMTPDPHEAPAEAARW